MTNFYVLLLVAAVLAVGEFAAVFLLLWVLR